MNEKNVTASINKLTSLALTEKDHASYNFLQWFVNEQLEEEQEILNMGLKESRRAKAERLKKEEQQKDPRHNQWGYWGKPKEKNDKSI